MAKNQLILVGHWNPNQDFVETTSYAIPQITQGQSFTITTSLPLACRNLAYAIFDRLRQPLIVSSDWDPKHIDPLVTPEELKQLQYNINPITIEPGVLEEFRPEGSVTYEVRLRRALKKVRTGLHVVYVLPEVIAQCLSVLGYRETPSRPLLVVIDTSVIWKPFCVKKVCSSLDEIQKFGYSIQSPIQQLPLQRLGEEEKISFLQVFRNALNAEEGKADEVKFSIFINRTKENLRYLAEKLSDRVTETQEKTKELQEFAWQENQTINEVSGNLRNFAEKQGQLEQEFNRTILPDLSAIQEIHAKVKAIEEFQVQVRTEIAALKIAKAPKNPPLEILSVSAKFGKYIASVRSLKHHPVCAILYLLGNGQLLKQEKVFVDAGSTEIAICDRKDLESGNYSLSFLDSPDMRKYLSNHDFAFQAEKVAIPEYTECFLYKNFPGIAALESNLMIEGGPRTVTAFQSVAAAWNNVDPGWVSAFTDCIRANSNLKTEEDLKQALKTAGFTFLE